MYIEINKLTLLKMYYSLFHPYAIFRYIQKHILCFYFFAQKYKLDYAGQLNYIETMKSKSLCFDIRMRIYFDFDMNIIRINLLVWPRLIIHNDVHWWIGVDTSGHETHYTATWDMCHISGGITSS